MIFFYNLSIRFYQFLILLASPFNQKAKQWISGRKNIFKNIEQSLKENSNPIIWFHAASLGEFEQGRPVIESFKEQNPDYKIVLTFFSPSGYEIRKDYEKADWVFYLPIDTKKNAKKFISIIQPKKVVFVKYEFWYHYINELFKNNIPIIIISAIFRKNQIFFKWYGTWYKKLLGKIQTIFVQNEASKQILDKQGIKNSIITGDTRFDRVYKVAQNPQRIENIESVLNKKNPTIIAGSTWAKEEEYLSKFYQKYPNINLIIAPHEIHESNLKRIESLFSQNITRYSAIDNFKNQSAILIDSIGILSSLYQYGEIAVIGGGFGKGIHNTLEAATFGLPIIIGPNYLKFNEAVELVGCKGAFSIENYSDFEIVLNSLTKNKEKLKNASTIVKAFVHQNIGATNKIINELTTS
jgi:3-deoxy-D-manno-octulosonic-acid transferase